jgi:hypothetical protein
MQANIQNTPLLNFNQNINTVTSGSNIGLNPIFSIIDSNLQQLKLLTNNTIFGGGIKDENVAIAGITSVSTNLTMDTINQIGQVDTSASTNDQVVSVSTSITVFKPNQKLHIAWGGRSQPLINGTSGTPISASRPLFTIEISSVSNFSSILATASCNSNGHFYGATAGTVDSWFFFGNPAQKSQVFTLATAGTYYLRVRGGHSGNYVQTSRVIESFITYIFN